MTLSLMVNGQPVEGYSGLKFKSVARGGFASVEFNLNRKLDASRLPLLTDVAVYDTQTAEQVGGGRLLEPTPTDDGTWSVSCLGEGLASMQDRRGPLFYVDQLLSNWWRSSRTSSRLNASVTQYPNQSDDVPSLVLTTSEDKGISTSASLVMVNDLPRFCGMQLGGVGFRAKSGVDVGDLREQVYAGTASDPLGQQLFDQGWSTTVTTRQVETRNGQISGDRDVVAARWFATIGMVGHDGDTSYVTEDFWSALRDIVIRSQIYGADGALRVLGYSNEFIRAHEIVTDLIYRRCPRLSVGRIETAANEFEQLAWLDGVTAMDVMDDVLEIEQAYTWDVYGRAADGTWPLNFRALPTEVRYEVDSSDGFQAPSPTSDVFNRVTVTGKTPGGRDVKVVRNSYVPDLAAAGVIREETIPLGSDLWSTSAANKAGDDFLAAHRYAPNAGTLTITRPVFDRLTRRFVKPHHIRPNELVQVRGVQPTPDALNMSGANGLTVFYIETASFDTDAGSMTLELDARSLTIASAVSSLMRRRARSGRK